LARRVPHDIVFQLLSLEKRHVVVKSFQFHDDVPPEDVLYEVLAQPFEQWGPLAEGHGEAAEVFIYTDLS